MCVTPYSLASLQDIIDADTLLDEDDFLKPDPQSLRSTVVTAVMFKINKTNQ